MTTPNTDYESEWMFREDDEAWSDYQAYLLDHDAYRQRGGILYADDFVTWLNYDRIGRGHRDRILAAQVDSSGVRS